MWKQDTKTRSKLTCSTLTFNNNRSEGQGGQSSLRKSVSGSNIFVAGVGSGAKSQRLVQRSTASRFSHGATTTASLRSKQESVTAANNVKFTQHPKIPNQSSKMILSGVNQRNFHPGMCKGTTAATGENKRVRFRNSASPFVSETKRSYGTRGRLPVAGQKIPVIRSSRKSSVAAKVSSGRRNNNIRIQNHSKIPVGLNSASQTRSKIGLNLYDPSFTNESGGCRDLMSTLVEKESAGSATIMISKKSELSLSEKKKLQWAKEREELNGLWSPWGKPPMESKSTSALYEDAQNQPTNTIPAAYVSKLGVSAQAVGFSQSDVYLPPIKGTMSHQSQMQHQKSTTWAIRNSNNNSKNDNHTNNIYDNNRQLSSRKSSLPSGSFSRDDHQVYHSQQYPTMESHTRGNSSRSHNNNSMSQSYHNDGNIIEMDGRTYYSGGGNNNEWASLDVDEAERSYHTSGYQSDNNNEYHTSGEEVSNRKYDGDHYEVPQSNQAPEGFFSRRSSKGPSPRVIVHKILVDSNSRPPTNGGGRGDSEYVVNTMSTMMSSSMNNNNMTNTNENLRGMSSRSFGGSTGYISGGKPPPVAMRSSLTIGIGANYGGSYEDVEKQEKEQWLRELEKQREEQRIRKLMEKEDKRARWGDKGIGVGHFWEPADSSNARLPATPHNREGTGGGDSFREGGTAQVSPTPPAWLERSLTRMQSSKSQPNLSNEQETFTESVEASNLFINQSSIDLRGVTGASPENDERTFIRGQNVPIDPDLKVELEKKRQANQEHLQAIKKQIEERQQKLKEEKEQRIQEEREHEVRIAQQRELELKRLEMEKRKRSTLYDDKPNESKSGNGSSEVSVEIFESGKTAGSRHQKHQQRSEQESPLIPHHVVHEPDAYELEIARRQSMLLSSSTDEVQRSNSSIEVRTESSSAKSFKKDQCLMTDTDHIYERTLTPTKERRSWSLDRSLREFGTQTEGSDAAVTTSDEKSSGKSRSRNSLSEGKSKSKDGGNGRKKPDEKPRWGANPVKKQYLKQSEKDPNYQQKLKRRGGESVICDTGTGTDESEDLSIPFPRIRSRKNHSPTRASHQGPLKALHFKTESNPKTKPASFNKDPSPTRRAPLKKNYTSDPSLNKRVSNSMNGIVNKNLGSIGGLNSVGTSEESGSGFTSPSLGNRNHSGSLRSNELSPEIPEYIPEFSTEFIPQKDFDEMPINAGKIAPGFQQTFAAKNSQPEVRERTPEPVVKQRKPLKSNPKPKARVVKNTAKADTKAAQDRYQYQDSQDSYEQPEISETTPSSSQTSQERLQSPPVPALLKKMQMGFQPDGSGRLSSLPTEFPEILSPIPTVSIGSSMATPIQSRLSSAAPKIDIDIAVTSASNPDLRRILETVQEQERLRETTTETTETTTTDSDSISNNIRRDDSGIFKLPEITPYPKVASGRSYPTYATSRPMTKDTDLSMQIQEDFIRELMSHKEVQEQISARESELSEKGIIEFNIRLPSRWANNGPGGSGVGSRNTSSRNRAHKDRPLEEYKDPLLSERRRHTANWLHSLDDSPQEAILTNLSSLKQGMKMQNKKVNLTAYEDSTTDTDAE